MSDNSARSLKRPNSLPKIDEPTKRQKVNEQTSPKGFTQSDIERNAVSIDGNTVGQEIHGANLDADIEDNVDDEEDVSDETIDNEDDDEDDEDTEHGNGVYHEERPWVEDMIDLEREENENLNNSDTTTGDDEATNHNEDRSEPEDNDLYARSSSSKNPFAGD